MEGRKDGGDYETEESIDRGQRVNETETKQEEQ